MLNQRFSSLLVDWLLISECQSIQKRKLLTLLVLNDFQLMGDVRSVKRRALGLSCLWQKYSQGVLVPVELQILSNEFVDDEVFVREVGPVGRSVV